MRPFAPLFLLLTLAARLAGAQQCPILTFPATAGCAVPFRAFLVAPGSPNNGREDSVFCPGAVYRFEHCAGRNLPAGTTYLYTADPLAPNCIVGSFALNDESVYRTPPVAATANRVVVTENAGYLGNGTLYQRTFRVAALAAPTFAVLPCPAGNVRLQIAGPANNAFFAIIGGVRRRVLARDTVLALPAGTAALTVFARPTGSRCELSATQTVPVIAPAPAPAIAGLVLDGALPGPATFTFPAGNLPPYYRYTLVRASPAAPGGYVPVANVPPGTATFPLPAAQPGCYALRRADFCRTDSAVSAEICTLALAGQALTGRNELALAYAGPPQALTLLRNGTALATLPAGITTYADRAVVCGTSYPYQVQADLGSGRFSRSNEVALLATTGEVPPTPALRVSFDLQNAVVLSAALPAGAAVPPGSTLRYRRSSGGGTPAELTAATASATAPPRPVRDSTALADLLAAPPCYSVRLVDVCRQPSPESPAACPALLTATPSPADPTATTLRYTPLQSPGGPFGYVLLVLDAANAELRRQAVNGGAAVDVAPFTDPQRLRYRLEITGPGGLLSYSNVATVQRPLDLAIPSAFTPNGDGLNDVLELKGRFLDLFTFVVVDRNGQEVFRATDRRTAWDGRINGRAPVNGAYVWRFEQADADGKRQAQTGTVMIVN